MIIVSLVCDECSVQGPDSGFSSTVEETKNDLHLRVRRAGWTRRAFGGEKVVDLCWYCSTKKDDELRFARNR